MRLRRAALLVVVSVFMGPGLGQAQTTPRFATINLEVVMERSKAVADLRRQVEEIRVGDEEELEDRQRELDRLTESLERDRTNLSNDSYEERRLEVWRAIADREADVAARERRRDEIFLAESRGIAAAIDGIVDEVRREQGYLVALQRSAIVGTADLPEITEEVLRRLDLQMPTVTVEAP